MNRLAMAKKALKKTNGKNKEAKLRGYKACLAGKPKESNPHSKFGGKYLILAEHWDAGWDEANRKL